MSVTSEKNEFLPYNVHSDPDAIVVIPGPQLLSAPGKWTGLHFLWEFFPL